ncbi:glutamate racemase [Pararhodonellum marinum]|uniref:glutamate racemase n=1 Tax=Pararhodonellum marinum TaxID=2755358 RepID=UPI00188FAE16|nr:aspartate/glutamate racemase family protein [Pararhodonellum marinum]
MKNCFIILVFLSSIFACKAPEVQEDSRQKKEIPIEQAILNDPQSFYFIDFNSYPQLDPSLPIGVFDSGTGGLTVLDAILKFDEYDNALGKKGQDGLADFSNESFIYLADQANMPYGNYASEENSELLIEHILKDTQFLLSDKYYDSRESPLPNIGKPRVKTLVIACNTATAYGKEFIEDFLAKTGIEMKVIGVIDAGSRGALENFGLEEDGTIGVMATVGTITSKGYENTLIRLIEEGGYSGDIQIYNQGGHGIAEAVDEEPDYLARNLSAPRSDYRGPGLNHPEFKIDKTLLDIYNFDMDQNKILCDVDNLNECNILQLNDPENYVRYHLVSLMEQMRSIPNAQPLKALILGCTHYPYLIKEVKDILAELYDYPEGDGFRYRHLMAKEIDIVDPSVNTARELYVYMKENQLFNSTGSMEDSQFYISVPNVDNSKAELDAHGRFTYAYKYGRKPGEIQEYVKIVPFSEQNIPQETLARLAQMTPRTFELMGLNLEPAIP